jgi:hypothetical protein
VLAASAVAAVNSSSTHSATNAPILVLISNPPHST